MKINIKLEVDLVDKKPIEFRQLKVGELFQHRSNNRWSPEIYLMVNPNLLENGQVFNVTYRELSWFMNQDMPVRRVNGDLFNKIAVNLCKNYERV